MTRQPCTLCSGKSTNSSHSLTDIMSTLNSLMSLEGYRVRLEIGRYKNCRLDMTYLAIKLLKLLKLNYQLSVSSNNSLQKQLVIAAKRNSRNSLRMTHLAKISFSQPQSQRGYLYQCLEREATKWLPQLYK
ncbi:hypothetical protein FGO68_gene2763 [Halteria grandinella]|uniref:Uncharacterized protein n=1 Tax=Halteria grandinella TaxID=5974 RepID=A0A8J8NLV2_HALGN|nr:hypothetical protein FGO68_gene2763 [Halteria grandinella]